MVGEEVRRNEGKRWGALPEGIKVVENFGMDSINSVTFEWVRAGPAYTLDGPHVYHSGCLGSYQPAIGGLEMPAGHGKYFYEIQTSDTRCKVGVCTEDAFLSNVNLGDVELRAAQPSSSLNSRLSEANCCLFNCLTCAVEVNGVEVRSLWRLLVPSAGARFGFLVNTNEGAVQLYVNGEYQGLIADTATGFKGKKLRPCIALDAPPTCGAGAEANKSSASVVPPRKIIASTA